MRKPRPTFVSEGKPRRRLLRRSALKAVEVGEVEFFFVKHGHNLRGRDCTVTVYGTVTEVSFATYAVTVVPG